MNQKLLIDTLKKIEKIKIGIIGDFCLDVYWDTICDENKISVETLKMINQVYFQKCSLGGAGNLALNVKALNVVDIKLFGIVGDDLFGREMLNIMNSKGFDTKGIFTQKDNWLTNTYIKPMQNHMEQNRFDLGCKNQAQPKVQGLILEELKRNLNTLDLVIVNQQWMEGLHAKEFRKQLSDIIEKSKVPFIVDSRNYPDDYQYSIRKMNDFELLSLYQPGLKPQADIDAEELKLAGLKLSAKYKKMIIVTRGNKNTFLINDKEVTEIPCIKVAGEIDTVGAGDSFLAGFSSVYGVTQNPKLGIEMGHLMASITIKKIRETGTASPEELLIKNKE